MNRLSWDTTAPRRLTAKRTPSPQPRNEDSVVEAAADLIRDAWRTPTRISSF
jgi:hypothetical protein